MIPVNMEISWVRPGDRTERGYIETNKEFHMVWMFMFWTMWITTIMCNREQPMAVNDSPCGLTVQFTGCVARLNEHTSNM